MSTLETAATIWEELCAPEPPSAASWLRWHPDRLDECVRARAGALPEPLAEGELEEVRAFNRRCGADEATLQAIDQLGSREARVVIAGQQPGLLGGPLYSLYKAAGAVVLAGELAKRHPALRFVPVFWIAGEDHDFDEVRSATWPKAGGELAHVQAVHPGWSAGRMVGTLPAAPILDDLIAAIERDTHPTEFRAEVIELLREGCAGDGTWEEVFGRVILRLLRGSGLVVVSPLMKWLRGRGAEVLAREAERAGESSAAVIARGEELKCAGRESPLHRRADAINLFWIDESECRHTLRIDGGRVFAARSGAGAENNDVADAGGSGVGSSEVAGAGGGEGNNDGGIGEASGAIAAGPVELAERIRREPERFSFNVVTRPLVQDSALPTVAQLIGPGEAAYLAQVEAVYPDFGVFAPVRFPRPELTLVTAAAARALAKQELTAAEILANDEAELVRRLLDRAEGEHLARRIERLHSKHHEELTALRNDAGTTPEVAGAIDKLLKAMEKGYQAAGERAEAAMRQRQPAAEQNVAKLAALLRPLGQPQERVFNPLVPFAVNHGLDWFGAVMQRLEWPRSRLMQIVDVAASSSK